MFPALQQHVLQHTGANAIQKVALVQSLWSDFGALERVWLNGYETDSIIIKRIHPPTQMNHPRGWNSDVSSQRKRKSYKIERTWYENYAGNLPETIKVPKLLFYFEVKGESVFGMEDLHVTGYRTQYQYNSKCFDLCLDWLARFHAFHMNSKPEDLWEVGTYWHLDTRQDEWHAMKDGTLKNVAGEIDNRLNQCRYQTLVHGDAKPANFCFTEDFEKVAAVDFQYVGGGCGMKDVIYLMSSALSPKQLLEDDEIILDRYFALLELALSTYNKSDVDFQALKKEWRSLYQFAWADFIRFLQGWSPEHHRLNGFTDRVLDEILKLFR